jgi:hypothetical protein
MFFYKSQNNDYLFPQFQYKLFPHNFSYKHSSTVRTQCNCATSPSDAVRNIVLFHKLYMNSEFIIFI